MVLQDSADNTPMGRYVWGPAVAFLFIALVAGFAIQRSSHNDAELLHAGLMAACERQNETIERENIRNEIMKEVLRAAAESRRLEAEVATSEETARVNNAVADRYEELAKLLPYAESVKCEEEVPNP